jgi:hypothetical protein
MVVPPPRPQIINHSSFILSQPYLILTYNSMIIKLITCTQSDKYTINQDIFSGGFD